MKDYYKILGVSQGATEKEIKGAYRKLAKIYHPDVVKDDEEKIKRMYEIQEAYGCLQDEEKRKAYDKERMQCHAGFSSEKKYSKGSNAQDQADRQKAPDRSQFERFFGFHPGKGMETYQDKKDGVRKSDGPIKPEEMFAAFFGGTNQKGGSNKR